MSLKVSELLTDTPPAIYMSNIADGLLQYGNKMSTVWVDLGDFFFSRKINKFDAADVFSHSSLWKFDCQHICSSVRPEQSLSGGYGH